MDSKLGRTFAAACGLAALLALGACGDRGSETAAERSVRNDTLQQEQNPLPPDDAATRAAALRNGSAGLAQGGGS